MARYYVNNNSQPNGDHEVHVDGCYWLSIAKSVTYLGIHLSCHDAVRKAKQIYWQSNGCKHCSPACHTT